VSFACLFSNKAWRTKLLKSPSYHHHHHHHHHHHQVPTRRDLIVALFLDVFVLVFLFSCSPSVGLG